MAVSIKTAVAIGSGLLVLGAGMGVASAAYADIPGVPNPTTAPTIAPIRAGQSGCARAGQSSCARAGQSSTAKWSPGMADEP